VTNRIAAFFLLLFIISALLISSCKRIHDSTELGDDLVPTVDNVNTFDTIVSVETYNDSFSIGNPNKLINDSTRISKSSLHYVGKITNDPLFGQTEAQLFMELKPPAFKYYFDTTAAGLFIDSVVLVLDYKETFGDTNAVQTFNVYELDNIPSNQFKADSNYLIRRNGFSYNGGLLLGSKTFAPNILNDSIKAFKDTTLNQLRIKLDNSFGTRLLQYDSSATGAYASDSAFRSRFKGFAVVSTAGGNALMGFALTGANTKLALYYRYKNVPRQDTTVRYFSFNSITCGNANYITRNYVGSPAGFSFAGGTTVQDDLIYLQNTPGTFARIKLPGLGTVTNRVVHRAELIIEQVYDLSDEKFFKPEYLMLDVLDTALKDYRYMPYDFTFDQTNSPNLLNFGSVGRITDDGLGNRVTTWKFNVTRYVQNYLTRREPLHDMRLFAPYVVYDIYKPNQNVVGYYIGIGLNSAVARGRVRVAGGSYSDPAKRMRLRIVYSKI
jgi:Domain of unknown function (DUF4270)